jgi:hypothetical protein
MFMGIFEIVIVVALVALVFNKPTRKLASTLLLIGVVLIGFMSFGVRSERRATQELSEQRISTSLPVPAVVDAAVGRESAAERPDWVDKPGRLRGSVYQVSAGSGPFVTDQECSQAMPAKIQAVIEDYANNLPGHNGTTKIPFDPELIRRVQKATYAETQTTSVGPMRQIYALVEFDDAARKELKARWQATIIAGRLSRVALGSGVVLSVLAIAFGYLKLDDRRQRAKHAGDCEPVRSGP